MSLTEAVRRAAPTTAAPPRPPNGPPPLPPRHTSAQRPHDAASAPAEAPGIGQAFRDFADTAGDALKAAAAGVPVGTPVGQAPPLSPEVVAGHLDYAGFWIRALAVFIDAVIVGVAGALIGIGNNGDGVLLLLYQGILIGTWKGQTLGIRACGIRVIATDGSYPTLGQSFGRVLAKLLSVLTLFVGYFMIVFDMRKRALHDRLAATLVVRTIS